jgi:ABC-2 type transport system ATP-binding protein
MNNSAERIPMSHFVVNIDRLSRRFQRTRALDQVSLRIERGRVFGLVGENGAGKTTLIQHVLGRLKPQSGTVSIFGLDPVHQPEIVLGQIGYMSEDRDLPDWMTIDQLIAFLRPFYAGWEDELVHELVRTFELDRKARISTLSRGQKARVGLLVALAHRPDLLVLDEPSSGLDVIVRRDILAAVIRTVVNEGRTVLFSSHLLDEVERVADDVAMLHRGELVLSGSLSDLSGSHHRLTFVLEAPAESPPAIEGVMHWAGSGREWVGVCNGTIDQVRAQAHKQNIRLADESNASLDEIFVAYNQSSRRDTLKSGSRS